MAFPRQQRHSCRLAGFTLCFTASSLCLFCPFPPLCLPRHSSPRLRNCIPRGKLWAGGKARRSIPWRRRHKPLVHERLFVGGPVGLVHIRLDRDPVLVSVRNNSDAALLLVHLRFQPLQNRAAPCLRASLYRAGRDNVDWSRPFSCDPSSSRRFARPERRRKVQREYFRDKLLAWREDILKVAKETLQHLQDENQNHADFADRASSETDRAIELRAGDRQRKLIAKIDDALQRLDDGTYGYCEEIGEPIALKRLEACPIATLSVEAQERHEQVYRDD